MAKEAVRLTHPGWISLKNKKRQYVNIETGEVKGVGYIQRHVAQREVYLKAEKPKPQKRIIRPGQPQPIIEGVSGTKYFGKVEVAPINRLERYNKMVDGFRSWVNEAYKKEGFPELSRQQVMRNAEFKDLYAAYKNSADREKGGRRHQALIAFGILDEDDDYY